MLDKNETIRAWWDDVLQSGGCVTSSKTLSETEAIVVPSAEVRRAFDKWRKSKRDASISFGDSEFTRRLRAVVPALGKTRPRVSGQQVSCLVFPRMSADRND